MVTGNCAESSGGAPTPPSTPGPTHSALQVGSGEVTISLGSELASTPRAWL